MTRAGASAGAWPILAIAFGVPAIIIGCTVTSAANGKVVMEPDRLIIADGLGREAFSARWDDVTGVFDQL